MNHSDVKFYPSGDCALTMEFGKTIDPAVNDRVLAVKKALEREPLPAVRETVPSYCSLLILFDPERSSYGELCRKLENCLETLPENGVSGMKCRTWKVPCCYGSHFGPDLETVCRHSGLSREEVIRRHSSAEYRIYMMGFLPGFVYLGGLDPKLAVPRLSTPRVKIPRGAVGIGGKQTGIYPLPSPGGWQLIGSTPLELYDPGREDPVFFRAGDRIRFEPVSSCEYYEIRQQILRGSYEPECSLAESGGETENSEETAGYSPAEFPGKTSALLKSRNDFSGPSDNLRPVLPGNGQSGPVPVLEVLVPGPLTTVQDAGRTGYQQLGIPVSGAMDQASYRLANALLDNPEGAAALELTLMGGSFRFLSDTEIALTGADMAPKLNGRAVRMEKKLRAAAGDLLELGMARTGCRAYLAVSGGISVPEVMGSRSTYVKCGIGGFEGRALRAGDVLSAEKGREVPDQPEPADQLTPASTGPAGPAALSLAAHPSEICRKEKTAFPKSDGSGRITVRVIPGPQDAAFTEAGKKTFYASEYILSGQSDRMGCRLEGPEIESWQGTDIVSDGTVSGSIQVTGAGRPIVLMADRQTTGGYAKIATVLKEDLPLLAQAVPGTRIRFEKAGGI